MRYLVTGGAGFVGSYIVPMLLDRGDEVVILDDLSTGDKSRIPKNTEFIEDSILNTAAVENALEGVDYVIHLAAKLSVPESVDKPLEYIDTNLQGTLNLLEACKGKNIKKFVHISTAAVYGDPDNTPLREYQLPEPLSPYGATKAAGEHYCQAYHNLFKIPTISLRFFNIYGLGQSADSSYAGVITKFMSLLKEGRAPTIFGDGSQSRDYIHVKDIARATIMACDSEVVDEIFNIGTGESTTVLQLAELIAELSGKDISPEFKDARAGDVQNSLPDVSKARKLLGFEAKINIKEGMKETYEV